MARNRSRAAPTQTRKASTMAAPPRQAPPPPPQQMTAPPPSAMAHPPPQQPGLMAQMASTAAGVAVGSAVGHTIGAGISSMFSGGSGSEPAQPQQQSAPQQQYQQPNYYNAAVPTTAASCEGHSKAFTECLRVNNNDVNVCKWYLEQLTACQNMASQY
ncbi:hypothetical protein BGX34_004692 [Mortierella sp. NVP85]|nr:hypothetical protein BGX34_004692 [Mortierella sp. NVP85]